MNQSIMGKALLKGTLMALTNACIIWLFAYIAGFDRSVWMVVIIIAGAALAYVTAFLEARAMQNAARGGDVSTSSSVVDSSDSSDSSDEEDDFVDPGPDPDAGDFDAGSSSSSDYSSYSSSDYSGGGDSGGGDSGGSSD
ncbi:hypothetical protein CYK05_03605 [Rothia mucilaginosa]|jgi:hypothetical protein|uniref:hypothetical protein n=1 Tax=Rothia TaxID=32207 RepID=UPI00066C9C33|nr:MULTISPECIES: hypothetical protein [Rothia]OHQ14609.1 hypothetical protein HMPREF2712_05985 [Rothia sp. HMSC064F07]PLA62111.1 hypothetical protein CYK05_03605 [Rothia mucilaginosa]